MTDSTKLKADSARLAIDGGVPLRTKPFGPRWVFGEEERQQVLEVLGRAPIAWRSGEKIRAFATEFSAKHDLKQVMPCGSGTGAIHAAIAALNPEPGDEVITTPVTDVGTVVGILQHNLIPVFVDWDRDAFNMDPADIERNITERTRAILVVHLFGNPCDMRAIMQIADAYGLPVIEDCAQAHLAEFRGAKVGNFGTMACFSFGQKTLTTGQGGAVATNDRALAMEIRGRLAKGAEFVDDAWQSYARLGVFYPMTDLQAAVGLAQLAKLEEATRAREAAARIFDKVFADLPGFRTPRTDGTSRRVHYVYPYHIDAGTAGVTVSDFVTALKAEGIADAGGPYLKGKPLYRYPLFTKARTYGASGFPLRDATGILRADYRALRLPVIEDTLPGVGFFHMRNSFTEDDARDIVAAIRKVARHYAANPKVHAVHEPAPASDAAAPGDVEHERITQAGGSSPERTHAPHDSSAGLFDLTQLGAIGDGRPDDAGLNDAAFARASAELAREGGRLFIPRGTYHIRRPIVLENIRNLHVVGCGGNTVNRGTRIVFVGEDPAGALDIVKAVHCRFEGIEFVVDAPGAEQVVQVHTLEQGPRAVSSLSIDFDACIFRATASASNLACGTRIWDAAHIVFRQCWFRSGDIAAILGKSVRRPPPTISNGLCNNVVFDNCVLFGDVLGVRGSGITFSNCQFSEKADGGGARIDMEGAGTASLQAVTLTGCFAIQSQADKGSFFTQGPGGAGLVMTGCRISGYETAVFLNGKGAALIAGNVFAQTAPGAVDIRVGPGAANLSIEANDSSATIRAGNEPRIPRPERASRRPLRRAKALMAAALQKVRAIRAKR